MRLQVCFRSALIPFLHASFSLIGTVIVDEDFYLFKVGPGGKWGVTRFCCLDVVPGDVLA